MWLIVGLGNPGKEYTSTFHNCGFMTLEVLAQKNNIKVDKLKWKGEYGRGTIQGEDCILLRPHTFMNLSGQSVIEVMRFFKIPLDHLIVIYDDIDIQRGKIRVRSSGSAGTHNGMKSVIYCVESQDFARVRIGCGPVPEHWDLADFVLSTIPKDEQETMLKSFEEGAQAVEDILSGKPIPGGRNRGGSHHS
ncbi:MAG: aminoacyl-tRNA hydrolase [Clostridiales bacterium]|nr:aminoacyl-tRNA hydrolase [Clostridiales bacterium]MBR5425003.1 aminoacyl-tRNA hydrolase [Clostridiales bacterium]MCR5275867.1 aminoacyl-tRNA hydrolase [Clostridiales bacterium]